MRWKRPALPAKRAVHPVVHPTMLNGLWAAPSHLTPSANVGRPDRFVEAGVTLMTSERGQKLEGRLAWFSAGLLPDDHVAKRTSGSAWLRLVGGIVPHRHTRQDDAGAG